jgi:hypothetical protein
MKLKIDIENISMNPKYFILHRYDQGNLGFMGISLSKDLKTSQKKISANKKLIEQLQGTEAKEILRGMIRKQREKEKREEEDCFFF